MNQDKSGTSRVGGRVSSFDIIFELTAMNPKIVMMLAKQVQECQKRTPDGIVRST